MNNSKSNSESPESARASASPLTGMEDPQILCTHDGVLLKKASAEHIAEINTSGSLSVVEYTPPRRVYLEWRPNENILIADDSQDQGDWALVDTIKRRTRTSSECKVFNTKPAEAGAAAKPLVIRTLFDDLITVEVLERAQTLRFIRKSDKGVYAEYFFQHGNADLFVSSMRHLHIIDFLSSNRNGEVFTILNTATQKLKKTFAELDIGEIKSSSSGNDSWLSSRFVSFMQTLPEYVQPGSSYKVRPGSRDERQRHKSTSSSENYQIIGLNGSGSSGNQSRNNSLEKVADVVELAKVKEEGEKVIRNQTFRKTVLRETPPLNETQWLEFQTSDHRVSDPKRVREIIFRGGIEPNLRTEVWKYLLDYYQWTDSQVERIQRRQQKSMEYYSMKAQWLSMTEIQEANFSGYRDRKCQIEKDVKRTDRTLDYFAGDDNPNLVQMHCILMTYVMYNFDLGYVQGMSDLLAPILAIEENEVDAFWCFVGFMKMVSPNFDVDQAGMKLQFDHLAALLEFVNPSLFSHLALHNCQNMYFCFRWLLVWYKREFSNDNIIKLWECLWTHLPCPNFHLFIPIAVLEQHSAVIMDSQFEFTQILKYCNELAERIDLKRTLEIAEAIYVQIRSTEFLSNDIRVIIGEPLILPKKKDEDVTVVKTTELEEGFDDLLGESTAEEKKKQSEQLEEACEKSMFLQFL